MLSNNHHRLQQYFSYHKYCGYRDDHDYNDYQDCTLCISLLYTESCPRSEHIGRKTATFGTFFRILSYKNALKYQAGSKASF